MIVAGVLLLLAAWWLLASAMPPRDPPLPPRRRRLRLAGAVALAASLPCFVVPIGVEQGPVFWGAAMMLAAMAIALVRALRDGGRARRG
ncbi:DUF3325 family protein [Luteimonas sp. SJ-92]|uniref:DUF3325 family protein n=1 Tax=Luteimonas salinisoli TaxID=2752307 RepID=A0A853J7U2_9GAMM|nr:DUF3325 family protein [Luteimonas salinisoli]NZA25181.1 DUF3325 family protein [Luteimonas salinisoli]